MAQENIIDLKKVSVSFQENKREIKAIREVDLQINQGEIFGVIGYSGAGKSTLVRVMNRLQKINSGEANILGKNISDLPQKELLNLRKKIGMIFQHFNLFPSRTVLNNIEYPLLSSKISKKDRREKAEELLKLVGLAEYAGSYPDQLSGGQKQRVAIARALANDPEILISDEATSALDPENTQSILQLLKDLNEKLGLTIVLITHEMNVIKAICQRVAVMDQGRIVEQGHVAEIFSEPRSKVSKKFIERSSEIKSFISKLKHDPIIKTLKKEDKIFQLTFKGKSATTDLMYQLAINFQLHTNILFGSIERINNAAIGYLVVIISGKKNTTDQALNFLRENGVLSRKIHFKEASE